MRQIVFTASEKKHTRVALSPSLCHCCWQGGLTRGRGAQPFHSCQESSRRPSSSELPSSSPTSPPPADGCSPAPPCEEHQSSGRWGCRVRPCRAVSDTAWKEWLCHLGSPHPFALRTSPSQLRRCWYRPFRTRPHFQAATILTPRSLLPPPAHPQLTGPEAVNLLSKLPTALGKNAPQKKNWVWS